MVEKSLEQNGIKFPFCVFQRIFRWKIGLFWLITIKIIVPVPWKICEGFGRDRRDGI